MVVNNILILTIYFEKVAMMGHDGHPNNLLAIQHLGLHLLWDLDGISPALPEELMIFMVLFP